MGKRKIHGLDNVGLTRRPTCASASAFRARGAGATVVAARTASATAASAANNIFRMLVFLNAIPHLMLISWLALVHLSSGGVAEGLPFAAISLMCASYFIKGAAETVEWIRSRLK